jgi:TRAP-type mannitol/chloroaromatic compound transport system permease large subunit
MTIELIPTLLLLGTFFVLLFLRVPVALAMIVGAVAAAVSMGISLPTLGQRMVGGLNSFPLLAIPLFILAGEIMGVGASPIG